MKEINYYILALLFLAVGFAVKFKRSEIKASNELYLKDSTNTWLEQRYVKDSILLNDLATLTTERKYDEVKMIFKLNNRILKPQ